MSTVTPMSGCTCNSNPAPSELDEAVAEVIRASAEAFDTKLADLAGRIDKIEAPVEVGETSDSEEAITAASPEDTADSRVRELENRVAQLEEALSQMIVESTPEMAGMN